MSCFFAYRDLGKIDRRRAFFEIVVPFPHPFFCDDCGDGPEARIVIDLRFGRRGLKFRLVYFSSCPAIEGLLEVPPLSFLYGTSHPFCE